MLPLMTLMVTGVVAIAAPDERLRREPEAPKRQRFESKGRDWRLELVPSRYWPAQKGGCLAKLQPRRPREASERGEANARDQRPRGWYRHLVNDRAPERAIVTTDGRYMVTIDEWPRDSRRYPLVIYGASGEVVRHFRPPDVLDKRAATELAKAEGPASCWRDAQFAFSDDQKHLLIRRAKRDVLIVELATGRLLRGTDAEVERNAALKRLAGEALEAGDDFFLSADPQPVADPGDKFDFLQWINDQFAGSAEQDSGPLIDAATALFQPFAGEDAALAESYKAWDPGANAEVAGWLDANADAMDAFRQAADLQRWQFDLQSPDGSMMFATLPPLAPIRGLARAMWADSSRALSEGDVERALGNYFDTLKMGRQLGQRPTLIEHLVGMAMTGDTYEQLLRLPQRVDGPIDYAGLRQRLAAPEYEAPAVELAMEFERSAFHDTMQRLFTRDPDSGETRVDAEACRQFAPFLREGQDVDTWIRSLEGVDYQATTAEADRMHDRWLEIMRTPFPQAEQMSSDLIREIEASANPMIKTMMPALSRVRESYAATQSKRRAALLSLALQEQRQRDGSFPASLDQLRVDGVDTSYFTDPLNGQSYRYESDGATFRLRSAGLDGVDDLDSEVQIGRRGGDHTLYPPP